jgi:hypothetical protein
MTTAASTLGVAQLLAIQLAAFQALLLAASGIHKLIWHDRTRIVVHDFAGVPRRFASGTVFAVAAAELLASASLWMPAYRTAGAALAVTIWGGYLALLLRAMARGHRDVDCGCSFGTAHRPLGVFEVARNAALMMLALAVAAVSATGSGGSIAASQALAGCALLALYGALDQVMSLKPLRSGELL